MSIRVENKSLLTCQNRQHHRRHGMVHQYGKQKIIIIQNSGALLAGMIVHCAVEYGHTNVDEESQMGHCRIASGLDVATS